MNAMETEAAMMTPDQAVRELLRIEQRTASLFQRTVGMTWMIWALINGGLFVSYEAIGLAAPSSAAATVEFGVVWLPWVLLGTIATVALWRSLAVVAPSDLAGPGRVTAVAIATFLVLVLGGLAVVVLVHLSIDIVSWPIFAVGVATAVVGGSGLTTGVRSERVLWLSGGILLAALAVAVNLLAGVAGYNPEAALLVLGPVASTALIFGGGLYTASR